MLPVIKRKGKNHTRITNSVTYAEKNLMKNLMGIKTTVRFPITALTWGNIQGLHIVSEIEDAKHQNKFLYCCIMVLIKTTISPFIRELAK